MEIPVYYNFDPMKMVGVLKLFDKDEAKIDWGIMGFSEELSESKEGVFTLESISVMIRSMRSNKIKGFEEDEDVK